jgi:hypothetical protein
LKICLGRTVPYAYAVKAGPWLFLTGHEAYDWRTGSVDEVISGPSGYPLFGHHHKSRREADFIFNRMRRVLEEFGADGIVSEKPIHFSGIANSSPKLTVARGMLNCSLTACSRLGSISHSASTRKLSGRAL